MPSPVFANNNIFKEKDTNNTNERWTKLKQQLLDMGYEFITADDNDLSDCEGIIFHDANSLDSSFKSEPKLKNYIKKILKIKHKPIYPTRKLYDEAITAGLHNKLLLLIWEGKTICPLSFSKKILNKFNHILTWDDDLCDKYKFKHYSMPLEPCPVVEPIPFVKKKFLVNISYNKYSSSSNELYSARRKSISYFDKHYPNDFDLYGPRWNIPVTLLQKIFPTLVKKYTSYRGIAENKVKTLSHYKFNICYENNSGQRGWITEKIFDSLHAKIVPIYWGATNIDQYVDADTFIDRRNFKTEENLASFLTKITEEEYQKYLDAGTLYMKSEKYKEFLPETFCNKIINALNLHSII